MEILRVNKRLPKIILPKEKTKLFIDWYKKDLCNEDNIPEVFDEGYFYVDLSEFIKIIPLNIFELDDGRKLELQKQLLETIHNRYNKAVIYFKFIRANTLKLVSYSQLTGELIGNAEEFDFATVKTERMIQKTRNLILGENKYKDSDESLVINISNLAQETTKNVEKRDVTIFNNLLNEFSLNWFSTCFYLLISSFWYLASIKNKKEEVDLITRSIADDSNRQNKSVKRNHNYIRNITVPIYDFSNTKSLNIDRLIAKKKGWKISCEFSVRGHYRHYKDGKVVFIKSFEKGKGLKGKQNIIRLNPSDEKIVIK